MDVNFAWSAAKEAKLIRERGLSFHMVVEASKNGKIVADFQSLVVGRSHQRVLLIAVQNYIVAVPYVTDGNFKFLKTMYFDRRYNEIYGV